MTAHIPEAIEAPSREELIANLEYATKLLSAWPILNATAQVQHLCNVVERARASA